MHIIDISMECCPKAKNK